MLGGIDAQATGEVLGLEEYRIGHASPAHIGGKAAARRECAARRQVREIGRRARNSNKAASGRVARIDWE